jgi:hypothetical protein
MDAAFRQVNGRRSLSLLHRSSASTRHASTTAISTTAAAVTATALHVGRVLCACARRKVPPNKVLTHNNCDQGNFVLLCCRRKEVATRKACPTAR